MPTPALPLLSALLALATTATAKPKQCHAAHIPRIDVFGLEVLAVSATPQHDFKAWTPNPALNVPAEWQPLDFCNITVTYTHPGQNDTLHVYTWLPLAENWNGRFLAMGGGGWETGYIDSPAPGVAAGYAGAYTDGGHTLYGDFEDTELAAQSWAVPSPGNVNWVLLQDFASRALDDLPKIAKGVIRGFYGEEAKFSYWNGCSTGGRQGLMSAQRYPENYDGILAAAPAINWASFLVAELWPVVMMRAANYSPPGCEFEAIRQAAIRSCDELDGVNDGVVAAPGLCAFNATSVVGDNFDCEGDERKISGAAASLANAIWAGPHRDGKQVWFGNTHETQFGSPNDTPFDGLAMTKCDANHTHCAPNPFVIAKNWLQFFLAKDAEFDVTGMDEEAFWHALHQSRNEYTSILDTADPDLSEFKAGGGKLITWHGLADQLIFPNGTSAYYNRVLALDPHTPDFFRHFEAPGVQHCFGGPGAFPDSALESLVKWVEEGVAPEKLDAVSVPADEKAAVLRRPLCPYPLVAAYVEGDSQEAASFRCAEGFEVSSGAPGGRHGDLK